MYILLGGSGVAIDSDDLTYVEMQQEHEAWKQRFIEEYGPSEPDEVRPLNSELYLYLQNNSDDVALCPRCRNGDVVPSARVCNVCKDEIDNDDFA